MLYNSVFMTGDRGAVASQTPSYAIAITGTDPTVELKNNAFATTQIASGGGVNAKSYAIGMLSTTFANLDANYNAYFSSGPDAATRMVPTVPAKKLPMAAVARAAPARPLRAIL